MPRTSTTQTLRSIKGQALVELTLVVPLMLLLVFGVVEIGSVISTYLTLTHTTREGANLTSRGTDPDDALDAIIAAANPTITTTNQNPWRVIYTRIGPEPGVPCLAPPCNYIAEEQIVRGNLGQTSQVAPGGAGATVLNSVLPSLDNVAPNQKFHAIEVYYDYGPNVITFIGNNINKIFYDRTIFTNVSGTS
jgi:TadE-like protein